MILFNKFLQIGIGRIIVPSKYCQNGALKLAKPHQNGTVIEEDKQIIVAFYRPAGNSNRAGQFASNVQKPVS